MRKTKLNQFYAKMFPCGSCCVVSQKTLGLYQKAINLHIGVNGKQPERQPNHITYCLVSHYSIIYLKIENCPQTNLFSIPNCFVIFEKTLKAIKKFCSAMISMPSSRRALSWFLYTLNELFRGSSCCFALAKKTATLGPTYTHSINIMISIICRWVPGSVLNSLQL